jgi:CRISPR-associated endonuclease/helicase Cas3
LSLLIDALANKIQLVLQSYARSSWKPSASNQKYNSNGKWESIFGAMIPTAWAKLGQRSGATDGQWHSLIAHATDVASVLQTMATIPTIRGRLAVAAERDISLTIVDRLCVLAFLHDLGKANVGFWCRQFPENEARCRYNVRHAGHIRETSPLFCDESIAPKASDALQFDTIETWGDGVRPLLFAMLAHHGRPVGQQVGEPANPRLYSSLWRPVESYDPFRELAELAGAARALFPRAFASGGGDALPDRPRFAHLFAGLLSLADWIGSNAGPDWFPPSDGNDAGRGTFARERARTILVRLGIDPDISRGRVRTDERPFQAVFDGRRPHPIQSCLGNIGDEHVVILEAETGSGKTEAALWHFYQLFRAGLVDGLYFALPTRIAATQIQQRITAVAETMFGEALQPVLAIPGYLKVGDAVGLRLPNWETLWPDAEDEHAITARWAAEHPKRFLTAPIAVGTIDQALLSGLQVTHAHMRATAELLRIVVGNHTAVGGRVLLLSATFGSSGRRVFTGDNLIPLGEAAAIPYPAVTRGQKLTGVAGTGRAKTVAIDLRPQIGAPEAIAAMALGSARRGATVVVIRNQVKDAIALQQALEVLAGPNQDPLFRAAGVVTLHHGRFARLDRQLLDNEVTKQFGKNREMAPRVVIGTQTLEQSLDIDADLMITDLCPMDVLLQRIGRLHRHIRARPVGFEEPRAIVLVPEDRDLSGLRCRPANGLGHWPDRDGVYDDVRIIEATLALLEQHSQIEIPAMNRYLVEHATHEQTLSEIGNAQGWEDENLRFYGRKSVAGSLAHGHGLNMEKPFDERLVFPATEERVRTRLGLDDRVIRLASPIMSPFGSAIDALPIPGWMARVIPDNAEVVEAARIEGGFQLQLGSETFLYNRFGLGKVANAT